MDSLFESALIKRAISPVSVADNTAAASQVIDVKGASRIEYLIATGSLADVDATFAVLIEGSDAVDMSGAEAIPDDDLLGTEAGASFQFDDDNEVRKVGVKNLEYRYYRLTITPTGNSGAALLSALAVLSGFSQLPVTQTAS